MSHETAPTSRYEAIACDLAMAIRDGRLTESERLSCRQLAKRYRVSAETVRRAALLLEEAGALRMDAGSGVVVRSRASAGAYLDQVESEHAFHVILAELDDLMSRRQRVEEAIRSATLRLLTLVARKVRKKTEGVSR